MKNEGIARRQIVRVRDNLVGVRNNRVNLDTPGFVPDNAFAVRACRVPTVAVAVISDSEAVVRHWQSPEPGLNGVAELTGSRTLFSQHILRLAGIPNL